MIEIAPLKEQEEAEEHNKPIIIMIEKKRIGRGID
jgi:hypothetical protein